VLGLHLLPRQAERLAAWVGDQPATALALGLELESWGRMVEAGMARYLESQGKRAAGEAREDDRARGTSKAQRIDRGEAERFLGLARGANFVAPPAAGPKGVLSLISAAKFPKKPS
jgi:hypothetical protein